MEGTSLFRTNGLKFSTKQADSVYTNSAPFRYRLQNAVFSYQQPQQAYIQSGGVLIPANAAPAQAPIIDYGAGLYAAAPVQSAYATDVAAATGNGKWIKIYQRAAN